ncbi:MAG: hypothetical protein II908_12135 [Bacteroidaceae bacterium]|nr:hypothetical protein [Bacteroidaceae bacterium]
MSARLCLPIVKLQLSLEQYTCFNNAERDNSVHSLLHFLQEFTSRIATGPVSPNSRTRIFHRVASEAHPCARSFDIDLPDTTTPAGIASEAISRAAIWRPTP